MHIPAKWVILSMQKTLKPSSSLNWTLNWEEKINKHIIALDLMVICYYELEHYKSAIAHQYLFLSQYAMETKKPNWGLDIFWERGHKIINRLSDAKR